MVHSGPVHEPPIISITPIIEEAPPLTPPPPPPSPAPIQKKQPPPQSEESSSASTSTSSPAGPAAIKYSCSDCSETFPSYVSMCKHRRTSHGTIGKHTKAASPLKVQNLNFYFFYAFWTLFLLLFSWLKLLSLTTFLLFNFRLRKNVLHRHRLSQPKQ